MPRSNILLFSEKGIRLTIRRKSNASAQAPLNFPVRLPPPTCSAGGRRFSCRQLPTTTRVRKSITRALNSSGRARKTFFLTESYAQSAKGALAGKLPRLCVSRFFRTERMPKKFPHSKNQPTQSRITKQPVPLTALSIQIAKARNKEGNNKENRTEASLPPASS